MGENTDSSIEGKLNEAGHLLLEAKCLGRLGALASDSCIIDDELQIQDFIDYYFVLMHITKIVEGVETFYIIKL